MELEVQLIEWTKDGRITLSVNGKHYEYECDAAVIRRALDVLPWKPGKALNMIKKSATNERGINREVFSKDSSRGRRE